MVKIAAMLVQNQESKNFCKVSLCWQSKSTLSRLMWRVVQEFISLGSVVYDRIVCKFFTSCELHPYLRSSAQGDFVNVEKKRHPNVLLH
jgi:hypothetical protein